MSVRSGREERMSGVGNERFGGSLLRRIDSSTFDFACHIEPLCDECAGGLDNMKASEAPTHTATKNRNAGT